MNNATVSLSQIVYETGRYWVVRIDQGLYRVLENGATHSTVVGTFHWSADPDKALSRAVACADAKAAGHP